jgi:hypothetical protein
MMSEGVGRSAEGVDWGGRAIEKQRRMATTGPTYTAPRGDEERDRLMANNEDKPIANQAPAAILVWAGPIEIV